MVLVVTKENKLVTSETVATFMRNRDRADFTKTETIGCARGTGNNIGMVGMTRLESVLFQGELLLVMC